MNSPSTELPARMEIYEQFHHISRWGDAFEDGDDSTVVPADVRLKNKVEYIPCEQVEPSISDQETNKPSDKTQRRLAQNREAARKCRLRKKAYVQQLESSRLKLAQLEQELERARQQGIYISGASDTGSFGLPATVNSGIAAFEMEYAHWIEEQNRQICELRTALQANVTDKELRILVESGLILYCNLFSMKADAAKADVFYLISGIWRTSAERFFQWIGGFRPSEILNVVVQQIEPLTDQQHLEVCNLRQSSLQTEDALSQGVDKLQQSLAEGVASDLCSGNYRAQMVAAIDKLEALENFVSQADHLRQQTLQQMVRILTTRQAARGFLALGEHFHRLRALSSLWGARPREDA
ncbi:Transcription factor TGA1 [Hibiscus syriacus]|uniref:Transcription factor TGA1 n=1 Tax=Hibiscus syriacus TaxID=106335 RepID=A0A6A2WVQ2_HIBSY|nr:transcription factor TGA3-like [Hibiscus syriacus]KAE8653886.1 Transcription factor TGA1 [Hibiscus syriacus]